MSTNTKKQPMLLPVRLKFLTSEFKYIAIIIVLVDIIFKQALGLFDELHTSFLIYGTFYLTREVAIKACHDLYEELGVDIWSNNLYPRHTDKLLLEQKYHYYGEKIIDKLRSPFLIIGSILLAIIFEVVDSYSFHAAYLIKSPEITNSNIYLLFLIYNVLNRIYILSIGFWLLFGYLIRSQFVLALKPEIDALSWLVECKIENIKLNSFKVLKSLPIFVEQEKELRSFGLKIGFWYSLVTIILVIGFGTCFITDPTWTIILERNLPFSWLVRIFWLISAIFSVFYISFPLIRIKRVYWHIDKLEGKIIKLTDISFDQLRYLAVLFLIPIYSNFDTQQITLTDPLKVIYPMKQDEKTVEWKKRCKNPYRIPTGLYSKGLIWKGDKRGSQEDDRNIPVNLTQEGKNLLRAS